MIPELASLAQSERDARLAARRADSLFGWRDPRPGSPAWWLAAAVTGVIAATAVTGMHPSGLSAVPDPVTAIGWAGVGIAGAVLTIVGWRRALAALSVTGAALVVHGVLWLVTPVAPPGGFVAAPIFVAIASPVVAQPGTLRRLIGRRWTWWVLGWLQICVALGVSFAVGVLDAVPEPAAPLTWTVVAGGFVGAIACSRGHLRLYRIGGRSASLVVALAHLGVGLSSATWMLSAASQVTVGSLLELIAVVSCLAIAVAAAPSLALDPRVARLIAPAVVGDQFAHSELGLPPTVAAYADHLAAGRAGAAERIRRTTEMAVAVGRSMQLDAAAIQRIGVASTLRDIGRLDLPDGLLERSGPFAANEWNLVTAHPSAGEERLAPVESLAEVATIVRTHHERIDGAGYPDSIAGSRIPIEARVIAVCDAYDAIGQDRPYRLGRGHEEAVSLLRRHAGTQWDAAVVEALVRVLGDASPWRARSIGPSVAGADVVDLDPLPAQPVPAQPVPTPEVVASGPALPDVAGPATDRADGSVETNQRATASPSSPDADLDAVWLLLAEDLFRQGGPGPSR